MNCGKRGLFAAITIMTTTTEKEKEKGGKRTRYIFLYNHQQHTQND